MSKSVTVVKPKITYEFFAHGRHLSDEDAAIAGPILVALSMAGKSKTQDVVDAARPDDAPLHRFFHWEDAEAAELYRRTEARVLIQAVSVRIMDAGGEEHEIRAFYAASLDGPTEMHTYVSAVTVLDDNEQMARVMLDAYARLTNWAAEYRQWLNTSPRFRDMFAQVFAAIDAVGNQT